MMYYKLVRDKVPEMIEEDGGTPVIITLGSDMFFEEALCSKLIEETMEYVRADPRSEVSELCDVYTVIETIAKERGLTMQDIADIAQLKNETHGAFNKHIKLLAIDQSGTASTAG